VVSRHKEAVKKETLAFTPYQNDGLGIDMQVAAGINGKTEVFFGGVRIFFTEILEQGTFAYHHVAAEP